MVSELPKHASPKDIEKGKKYRSRFGNWQYKVLEINQAGSPDESTLGYEVIGGPLDATRGNTTLAEFAQRVRYIGR